MNYNKTNYMSYNKTNYMSYNKTNKMSYSNTNYTSWEWMSYGENSADIVNSQCCNSACRSSMQLRERHG